MRVFSSTVHKDPQGRAGHFLDFLGLLEEPELFEVVESYGIPRGSNIRMFSVE